MADEGVVPGATVESDLNDLPALLRAASELGGKFVRVANRLRDNVVGVHNRQATCPHRRVHRRGPHCEQVHQH